MVVFDMASEEFTSLLKENQELKKQLKIEQENNEKLKRLYKELNNKKLEDYIKEHDYVILVKNYKVALYNQGRKEERVRDIEFSARLGEMALLRITK